MAASTSPIPSGSVPAPVSWELPVHALSRATDRELDFAPERKELRAVAKFLGLEDLATWRIKGRLIPAARDSFRLEARMTAKLTQKCVVTLDPVPARIDEDLLRTFVPEDSLAARELVDDLDPEGEDAPETYGQSIDLGAVAIEALALALDPYPRADDVDAETFRTAPPGVEPLTDEALRPFAKLAALKEKMSGGQGQDDE